VNLYCKYIATMYGWEYRFKWKQVSDFWDIGINFVCVRYENVTVLDMKSYIH
jgi:hypothetical protein